MACCKCQLISQSDFAGIVDLPENISSRKVNVAIRETKFLIRKYICADLYDELCQQIEDDELTTENEELLCLIKEIWVRYAYAELFTQTTMKLSAENVVRKTSDESELVSFSEAEKMANDWRMKALNYVNDMLDFLKNNVSLNSLYANDCRSCEEDVSNEYGITYGGIA